MTDSMKFGPEWLRNLSTEGSTGGAPKYQLAEHRYGREEMLALFDRNVKAPDPLVKLQGLYIEKTQTPMALLTMTEEETRQWNKGINSDAVLRLAGKTLPGPPTGGLRGRGGSIDRGRGRLRGSGGFHYSRGLSYEEQSDGVKEGGPPERGFSRSIRSFDRSQGVERSWGERNGGDPGDWNGSTSPRKEYSSLKDFSGGGRNNTESWRRHRGTSEDEEGWRKSDKWGRSNSWRDEAEEGGILSKSNSRTSNWGRGWADEGLRGRSHDEDSLSIRRNNFVDEVPEWAMENPSESGGSFDATGAFHGGNYSDEEEEPSGSRSARNRLSDDVESRNKSRSPPRLKKPIRSDYNDYDDECEEFSKERKLSRSQTAQGSLSEPAKTRSGPLAKSQSSSNIKTEPPEIAPAPSKRTESQNFERIRAQHQNFINKNGTNKESSDGGDVSDKHKEEDAVEPNGIAEEVLKSETSVVLEGEAPKVREKSSIFPKENVNRSVSGVRLPEEDVERRASVNRQGSEEDMERMAEVVKDTVVKLFEDEEKPPVNHEGDKWYYTDPQGVVQGPFRSSEMLEWFVNGYFALSLLVRREQDELYVKLGDLMLKCGKNPFLPGVNLPPLKASDAELQQPPPTPQQPQPHGLAQPDLFMQQYHPQYQLLQKQFLLSHQLALNKLSQTEMWSTLSPVQQRILLMQKLALSQQTPLNIDQLSQVEKNPLSQLIAQMQQQNKIPIPEVRDTKNIDPLRQLLQHMNVMQTSQPPLVTAMNPAGVMLNHHMNPQAHLNSVLPNTGLNPTPGIGVEEPKVEDPIQSLLRQLGNQSNIMPQAAPAPTESLWGAPGRPQQHWSQPNPPVANAGGLPLWEIKTEQQILAEQQLRLDEERRQEELRKRKEEEESAKKQKELEEKRREEEKREEMKRLELKRIEEEKQRLQKEREEKKKAEELKKKTQEEAQKKKQEMARQKLQEAQKKKDEKERKKEEEREKKRLLEEGKKKLEMEKKKKEEELQRLKKKQDEEEETAKKQEQAKRPIDALKKMQEQQMEPFKRPLPWSQPSAGNTGTSLSDIQKMQEKEKKQREQQAAQQLAQQKELQQMQNENRSNGLNLKWAEQMPKANPSVKSLAEIQAEEQLQLAKQWEKERLERLEREKQQREATLTTNTGIWGNASQSLSWTNSSSPWGVTPVQNNPSPGFWDEVAPTAAKTKTKTPSSPVKGKTQQASTAKQVITSATNQKNPKPKTKKEEAAVMKLFERLGDEFTSWCSASLQSIQSEVDIPTFVSFLREIESPFEVTEYVKCYFGDGKEAQEFTKQFLERRSRWMSAQKANSGDNDRSSSLTNNSQYQANASQEFQEVKGKGKKSKKGKMLKVDNRILGFSVTAAPDRINIEFRRKRNFEKTKSEENNILAERYTADISKLAHQFWFSTSYPLPGSGGGRGQTEDEKKEKKEQAEAVARAEIAFQAAQQQRIQHRAEKEQREFEREVREQTEYLQQRERDLIQQQRECSSASLQSICRAPIASLDCMEEFTGTNEHLTMHVAPTKEALLSGFHSQTPLGTGANPVSRQGSVTPGLRYRNLGKSGLRVSNIGLGTWVTFGSNLTEEQAEDVIALAYESGINVFDLSEAYSGPRAETELGRILSRRGWKRSSYIVTTKIYWNSKSDERGLSRKHILECVKASLQRLNLEYIDIIILHKADPMCPMEEIVRAMNHVISQGWALYWGTARWSMVEVMEAYTNCRTFNCVTPICEQSEYHMFCREKTELYMPELYNKIGVGLMAWAPLTMGIISGKIEDGALPLVTRSSLKNKYSSFSWAEDETTAKECTTWLRERLQPEEIRKQQEKIKDIALLAEKLGCTLTQLSIAWCLKNESVQCLLLGATTVDQLYENIQSLQLIPKLNTNLMSELERILENKPTRPPIVSTLALR